MKTSITLHFGTIMPRNNISKGEICPHCGKMFVIPKKKNDKWFCPHCEKEL